MYLSTLRSLVFVALAKQCLAGSDGGLPPPEISIGLNTASASTSKFGGIEPLIKWKNNGKYMSCDVEGGIDITLTDVNKFKESVWGKVKKNVKGFGLSAAGKMSLKQPKFIDFDIQCDTPAETKIQALASTTEGFNGGFSVDKVKMVQALDTDIGAVVIAPTYDMNSRKGDLSLAYANNDSSSIQVDVNTDKDAKVTFTKRVGDTTIFQPSLTTSGQVELQYDTKVAYGTLSTTYKPDHHVNVKWSDGAWQANFNAPMSGYYNLNEGVKVSVKTKVDIDYTNLF